MKSLKYSIFLVLITLVKANFSQNYVKYLRKANEAEYQLVKGNVFQARSILIALDVKYPKLKYKDYFYLGIIYYLCSDTINGYRYLEKFTTLYGKPTQYIEEYRNKFNNLYIPVNDISRLQELEKINQLKIKDTSYFNLRIKPVIDSITIYLNLDRINRKNDDTSPLDPNNDYNTQLGFLKYLKTHKIPEPYFFGNEYTIILSHVYNEKLLKQYKKYFYTEIKRGNAYPMDLAILTDRKLAEIYSDTKYGSWFLKSSKNTSKSKIINNRKTIGMSPYFEGAGIFPITNFPNL